MAAEDVLPTLILIAIVYGLYRWLTGPKTPSDPFRGVRREMVEAVTSAFPDVPLEAVVYSLQRTRNPQTTSEIILERGTLPSPPSTFTVPDHLRPVPVPAARDSTSTSTSTSSTIKQSLIERYGLTSRVSASVSGEKPEVSSTGGKWEATREQRELDLRARKERMILEARKRMLAKEKGKGVATDAPAAAAAAE